MHGVREYLLSVTSAAVICAIAKHIVGDKGSVGKIISVVTGLFLCVTLISPVIHVRLDDIEDYFEEFSWEAGIISANGTEMANEELTRIIKQQSEAYILDEAERLGTQMDVEVTLSDSDPPVPYRVRIQGSVSPYQKQCIRQYITDYLGIPQENQIWN